MSVTLSPNPTLKKLREDCHNAEKNKNWVLLQQLSRQFLEIRPQDPNALHSLALALIKQKNWLEALPYLKEATLIDPTFTNGWTLLGEFSFRSGYNTEAWNAFSKAWKLNPTPKTAAWLSVIGKILNKPQYNSCLAEMFAVGVSSPIFDAIESQIKTTLTGEPFAKHYYDWRRTRLSFLIKTLSPGWFAGRKILELGCGYGDNGIALSTLGAQVFFSDARQEHLDELASRYPSIPCTQLQAADINHEWPFSGQQFDLIIHWGVLYHLTHWQYSLEQAYHAAPLLSLETEVCDATDGEVKVEEFGWDKAIDQTATIPSANRIETQLEKLKWTHTRYDATELNASPHRYDWTVQNTHLAGPAHRRFWIAKTSQRHSHFLLYSHSNVK